jgi:flavin-dependent dehydrogenase
MYDVVVVGAGMAGALTVDRTKASAGQSSIYGIAAHCIFYGMYHAMHNNKSFTIT